MLTDQGIDPREQKADLKAKTMASKLKGIQALEVWKEYVADRKDQWGERHLFDHNGYGQGWRWQIH